MAGERTECKKPCKVSRDVLKKQTVNIGDPATSKMDLRDFQGKGKGTPGCRWRLVETSYDLEYASGEIDCDGELVGLPSEFESHYSYDGYMELQILC